MSARSDLIRLARVHLTECSCRRNLASRKDFYWTVIGWAQNARRRAATCNDKPAQGELF
jgi:hypothetical protein